MLKKQLSDTHNISYIDCAQLDLGDFALPFVVDVEPVEGHKEGQKRAVGRGKETKENMEASKALTSLGEKNEDHKKLGEKDEKVEQVVGVVE